MPQHAHPLCPSVCDFSSPVGRGEGQGTCAAAVRVTGVPAGIDGGGERSVPSFCQEWWGDLTSLEQAVEWSPPFSRDLWEQFSTQSCGYGVPSSSYWGIGSHTLLQQGWDVIYLAIYLASVRERGFAYTSVAAGGWAPEIFLPPEVAGVPFLQHEVLGSCSLLY